MSDRKVARWYAAESAAHVQFDDEHGFGHEEQTTRHDTSSQEAAPLHPSTSPPEPFKWPYHAPTSATVRPAEQRHVNTPYASTFTSSYYPATSSTASSSGRTRPLSTGSLLSTSSASRISEADTLSDFDASTAVGSEESPAKPKGSAWQPVSYQFGSSHRGPPQVSPISPLTVRDPVPQSFSQDAEQIDLSPQTSLSRTSLHEEDAEPELEGVSAPNQRFSRPLSLPQRSSLISSRRQSAPVTRPSHHFAASRLFLDPLGPPSDDPSQPPGLPSLRHIITATDPDETKAPVPPIFKDTALVNHLETLQRDAISNWAQATETDSEEEADALVHETVGRLWHTSVSFLADLLRTHRMLRHVANTQRASLGELDKLRQYSQDAEVRVVEQERHFSLDLEGLKRENKELRKQLARRDLQLASQAMEYDTEVNDEEVHSEGSASRMGSWTSEEQASGQAPSSQTDKAVQTVESAGEEDTPAINVSETDRIESGDKPAVQPLLKERPAEHAAYLHESQQSDPQLTAELLQNIVQLRENLENERFEREAAQEQIYKLEQEVALFHGSEAASSDTSKLDSARDAAAKRLAEITGVRAALRTAQLNYEMELAKSARLQKMCDELEGYVAARDHMTKKLERELRDVQEELRQERMELNDAKLEAEERECLVADLRRHVNEKKAETSRLDSEMKVLVGELNAAQASLVELREKNKKLADELYDQQTANGMQLQDLEYEKYMRAQEKAELDETKKTLATWSEHCDGLDAQIKEYEEAVTQNNATEAQLQKDLDLLNNYVTELEVVDCDKTDEIQALKDRVQQLMQDNQSIGETNKRLAEYLKSQRLEEGWKRLEELRLRCHKLQEQRAAWAPAIREMAVKKGYAEQRYRQAHRALMKARQDLEELQQQRDFDAEREKQLVARVAFLERECENARLALQLVQLRLAGAKQIAQSHEREIDDVEGILASIGVDMTGHTEEKARNLVHTALPQPPIIQQNIITRTVEHHHSTACFCSLVEYWFPGALDRVLLRQPETEDSGYDSDSTDGQPDPTDSVSSPDNDAALSDEASNDGSMAATDHTQTSRDQPASTPTPTREDDSTSLTDQSAEYNGLGGISLRGGAGSPPSPGSEVSFGSEEKMETARFANVDNWWDRPVTPEASRDEEDASRQSSDDWEFAKAIVGMPLPGSQSALPVQIEEAADIGEETSGSTVRGKHSTTAGERIEVETGGDGGLKIKRSRNKPSAGKPAAEGLARKESTAHPAETQEEPEEPTEVEQEVAEQSEAQLSEAEPLPEGDFEEAQPEEAKPEEEEAEEAEAQEVQPEEAQPEEAQPEEAQPEEAQPEEAQPAEEQHAQGQSANPQPASPQPPRRSHYPLRPPRRVSSPVPASDPAAYLLELLDTSLRTPPLSPSFASFPDDLAFYTRQIKHHYHGHTSNGPFNGPGHFVCQLLTALAWLAMLILAQPTNLLSTTAVFAGYFLLPLRYILSLAAYYIRLPLFYTTYLFTSLVSRSSAPKRPRRPARPVLGRVSAAAIVSSVVSLGVVFLLVALEALRYEREIWLRPNRWTASYLRDVIDRRPYPWWSPVDADFRLAALEWVKWKVNVLAFGERYLRTW